MNNTIGQGNSEQDISDLVPESEKMKLPYLRAYANYCIRTLVHENPEISEARNLYNGEYDMGAYQYLQDQYGMESPAQVRFVPLIRKHIQVLLGQQLTNPLNYKITCSDQKSLNIIAEKKKYGFLEIVSRTIAQAMTYSMEMQESAQQQPNNKIAQMISTRAMQRIQDFMDTEWVSDFEEAAQHLSQYFIHHLRLKGKIAEILENGLIADRYFYRVMAQGVNMDPDVDAIPAEQLHFDHPGNNVNINRCQRIVRVFEMTRLDIMNKWGHEMKKNVRDWIGGRTSRVSPNGNWEISSGKELDSLAWRHGTKMNDKLKVYHVEWVANNEIVIDAETGMVIPENTEQDKDKKYTKRFRKDRYEIYRVEEACFFGGGKSLFVPRPDDRPWECYLSYSGRALLHNGRIKSLPLITKDLQHKYNIVHFYLENDIANMLGEGVNIMAAHLPEEFGNTVDERVAKALGYLKQKVQIKKPNQSQMREMAGFNTSYADSFKFGTQPQSIDAEIKVLEFIEATASAITGVNRQALGQLEERDGMGNTKIAMAQTALITKPQFAILQEITCDLITDLLQMARLVYTTSKSGAYPVGGDYMLRAFTVNPKHLLAYFNTFVTDSGLEQQDLDAVKALSETFASKDKLLPDALLDIVTSRSVTAAKRRARKGLVEAKDDEMESLTQKLEQLQQQLQQRDAEAQKIEAKLKEIDDRKLALEERKVDDLASYQKGQLEVMGFKETNKAENDKKQIEVENNQMLLDLKEKNNEPVNEPQYAESND